MISKKLCHLFSCTEKSYHIHTFKKPASVPKPNPLCALPPVPVNLGCGKADGQRQMTLLKPWQIKKNVHPPKRHLRRQASAKIKKLMTRISCPKRCKQLFFKVEVFLLAPKTGTGSKCFGVNLERCLKIFSEKDGYIGMQIQNRPWPQMFNKIKIQFNIVPNAEITITHTMVLEERGLHQLNRHCKFCLKIIMFMAPCEFSVSVW